MEWGRGTVLRAGADTLTVLFDAAGYRTLAVDLVEQGNLLTTVDRR